MSMKAVVLVILALGIASTAAEARHYTLTHRHNIHTVVPIDRERVDAIHPEARCTPNPGQTC